MRRRRGRNGFGSVLDCWGWGCHEGFDRGVVIFSSHRGGIKWRDDLELLGQRGDDNVVNGDLYGVRTLEVGGG